jgi:hypothetical protein
MSFLSEIFFCDFLHLLEATSQPAREAKKKKTKKSRILKVQIISVAAERGKGSRWDTRDS